MNDNIPLTPEKLQERRQRVFLILAGIFLGTLAMLNILGVSRFLDLSFTLWGVRIPFALAVGSNGRRLEGVLGRDIMSNFKLIVDWKGSSGQLKKPSIILGKIRKLLGKRE